MKSKKLDIDFRYHLIERIRKNTEKYKFFYYQRYPCLSESLDELRSTSKNVARVIGNCLEDEK